MKTRPPTKPPAEVEAQPYLRADPPTVTHASARCSARGRAAPKDHACPVLPPARTCFRRFPSTCARRWTNRNHAQIWSDRARALSEATSRRRFLTNACLLAAGVAADISSPAAQQSTPRTSCWRRGRVLAGPAARPRSSPIPASATGSCFSPVIHEYLGRATSPSKRSNPSSEAQKPIGPPSASSRLARGGSLKPAHHRWRTQGRPSSHLASNTSQNTLASVACTCVRPAARSARIRSATGAQAGFCSANSPQLDSSSPVSGSSNGSPARGTTNHPWSPAQ